MNSGDNTEGRVKRALAAAEDPVLVNRGEQLESAALAWRNHRTLGLDTEFVRERTYRAALGLVQVSDGETAWLVDPMALEDLTPLVAILRDPAIEKVIHSGSEDFEVMFHQLGTVPESPLDSQIACAMLGQSLQLGYHNAVNWLFDVEVDKGHTRSNWLRRPLSTGQLRYAALDVTLLPLMMERLRKELEQLGRMEWLLEDVARMSRVATTDTNPEEAWMRIGGAGWLADAERKALVALASWRERIAQSKDLARGFVVSDAGLLALAKTMPSARRQLDEIDALHPREISRYGEAWLEQIEQARNLTDVPPMPQLTGRQRKWLKSMRALVTQAAKSLNVDAALLASRKQLEDLILVYSSRADIPERFGGWRKQVITDDLLQVMDT